MEIQVFRCFGTRALRVGEDQFADTRACVDNSELVFEDLKNGGFFHGQILPVC